MCCQLWLEGFGTGGCTPSMGEGSVSGGLGVQGGLAEGGKAGDAPAGAEQLYLRRNGL